MAYIDQKLKAQIALTLKAIVPATWKYSLRVNHNSTLEMTIKSASVDLLAEYHATMTAKGLTAPQRDLAHIQLNPYYPEHAFSTTLA